MNDKPILFNTDMVLALLDGRKTQTRRIFKDHISWQGGWGESADYSSPAWNNGCYSRKSLRTGFCDDSYGGVNNGPICLKSPYGQPGDLLCIAFRLTLKITDIRVERVQDISEEDAIAEGIEVFNEDGNLWYSGWMDGEKSWFSDLWKWHCNDPISAFKELWDGINFKSGNGWATNPFVWVVSFEVIEENINTVLDKSRLSGRTLTKC